MLTVLTFATARTTWWWPSRKGRWTPTSSRPNPVTRLQESGWENLADILTSKSGLVVFEKWSQLVAIRFEVFDKVKCFQMIKRNQMNPHLREVGKTLRSNQFQFALFFRRQHRSIFWAENYNRTFLSGPEMITLRFILKPDPSDPRSTFRIQTFRQNFSDRIWSTRRTTSLSLSTQLRREKMWDS